MVLSVIVYNTIAPATRNLPPLKETGRFLKHKCMEEHLFVHLSYQRSSRTKKSPAEHTAVGKIL